MNANTEKNGLMTVGEAAKAVGVAGSVLRYYEKEGLLVPSSRGRNGYRMYDGVDVDRLRFIRSAQAVGFTLGDIRALLDVETGNLRACQSEVQALLERRLAKVDEKMKDLKRVRAALGQALDRCRRSTGECAVIKDIGLRK